MSDTDECECGHVRDEHGDATGLYPNSTPCQVDDCRCVCFDPINSGERVEKYERRRPKREVLGRRSQGGR